MSNEKIRIFVYGTLLNNLLRRIVCGKEVKGKEHRLHGYRKTGIAFLSLTLKEDPQSSTLGEIIEVDRSTLKRLLLYERNYFMKDVGDGLLAFIRKK